MGTTPPKELHVDKHVAYIKSLDTRRDELEYWLTEHLRINGVYWGLTALDLLGHRGVLPRDKTIEYVKSCQHENGGFGAHPGHDAHILTTVSAVQILAIEDALDQVDKDQIARYVASLQDRETGIFAGDQWGEVDTRFIYGAFNCLSLLGKLNCIDVEKAVQYVLLCKNYDGGFGMLPGAESHAGQIFTCIGTLAIAKKLELIDHDLLGEWLCERQLPNGGLNGRPEKLEDVCYSWWVLSSLAMIDRLHYIDRDNLIAFILSCQDPERGGIADRPNDMPDVFHTVFGVAGLSLLGYPGLREVDPKYCMPTDVIKKVVGQPVMAV
ncbi:rab geranylgeranyltransferase beta subunit [Terfezia boudieri ATCC MYA-4762]|uniref:Geranylgeranyl transferase type-2 subunit beta n=1 Tax=Terfezia boudieri ATCC MYA-4762 TaxID=1051890 RepID=A0A3N4M358_9PEZI|nr:rab geranylgeranyltransferase beta subunit [Terfezia boudieri ATCC MYA-4762]